MRLAISEVRMTGRRNIGFLFLVVLICICVGFAAQYFAFVYVIALSGALVLVLVGRSVWIRISRSQSTEMSTEIDVYDDLRFRGPRRFFYLGLLSSCWLVLRVHGITVSDALFFVALTLTLVEQTVLGYKSERVLTPGIWTGIGLFVIGGVLSTVVNSQDMLSSLAVVARVFYLVAAWFWVGGVTLRTREQLWQALKYWVISAAICGGWAVGQKFGHLPGGVETNRFAGLSDHVNDLGAITACALVPALALTYRSPRWVLPTIGIVAGLILSGSIGAGFAALIALGVGLASRELFKPTIIALGLGIIILAAISPLIGSSAITRFSTATNGSAQFGQDTFQSRVRIADKAWRGIEAHPFIGTGLDVTSSQIYDGQNKTYYQVHNLFLGRWYDSGILGLAGILILVGTLWKLGWDEVLKSPDRYLALVLFAGFIAYLGDEMSEPSLYKRYSLVPAMLILALHRLSRAPRPIFSDHVKALDTRQDSTMTSRDPRNLLRV